MKDYQSPLQGGSPIFFGEDSRELLLEEVEKLSPDRVYLVTDRTVEGLYSEEIRELLPHSVAVESIVFNEGEENKNLATLQHVAGDLLRAGVTDRSLVLNVGGGVVLNMGGMAASLLCRGVRFAHVATTVTAGWQVVTSNLQGVNFVGSRNALRVYRAPVFSIVDPYYLGSEPDRQVLAALVDALAHALVLGGGAYEKAIALFSVPGFHRLPALSSTLEAFLELRLEMARSDPDERISETLDQYGATVGRAMEIQSEGRLLRGEAHYFGMRVAAEVSLRLGLIDRREFRRHEALLDLLPLGMGFPDQVRTDHLIFQLHGNNKTLVDGNKFMLLSAIGHVAAPPGAKVSGSAGASGSGDPGNEAGASLARGNQPTRIEVTDAAVADAVEKVRKSSAALSR